VDDAALNWSSHRRGWAGRQHRHPADLPELLAADRIELIAQHAGALWERLPGGSGRNSR
jgi:hypothetical protein